MWVIFWNPSVASDANVIDRKHNDQLLLVNGSRHGYTTLNICVRHMLHQRSTGQKANQSERSTQPKIHNCVQGYIINNSDASGYWSLFRF